MTSKSPIDEINKARFTNFIKSHRDVLTFNPFEKFKYPQYKKTQATFFIIAEQDVKLGLLATDDSPALGVYHLQQAVEKTTKGLMLGMGYTMDDFRRTISHKTHHLFINTFEQVIDDALKVSDIVNQKPVMLDFVSKLKELKNKRDFDFATISVSEIDKIIKIIEKLRKRKEFDEREQHEITNFIVESSQNFDELKNIFTFDNLKEIVDNNLLLSYYDLQVSLLDLFALSFITYPHEVYSRYPEDPLYKKPSVTFDEYRKGLGIVDRLDQLLQQVSNDIYSFREMNFDEFKSTISKLCKAMNVK